MGYKTRRHQGLSKMPTRFIVTGGGGNTIGKELREWIWNSDRDYFRARCHSDAPALCFKGQGWQPEQCVHAIISEAYDPVIEERECDLQMWQHWANVRDFLDSM